MTYKLEARGGWAGYDSRNWRYAVDGTANQTGQTPEGASAFDDLAVAIEVMEAPSAECGTLT